MNKEELKKFYNDTIEYLCFKDLKNKKYINMINRLIYLYKKNNIKLSKKKNIFGYI